MGLFFGGFSLYLMQFAEVEMGGNKMLIKTKSEALATKILHHLKIKPPKNIMPMCDFNP